jgi:hypothetical protein
VAIKFYGDYQVYSESGVDLTLLRENLRRSSEVRWEYNRRAAEFAHASDLARRSREGSSASTERDSDMFDPAAIIKQLLDHHVDFVVIGGLAMTIHGSAHVTRDLDICYGRTSENLKALVAAFTPLHPYLRGAPAGLPFKFDVETLQAGQNFTLTTDLGDVDLLGEVSGVGAPDQVFAASAEHTLFGLTFRVLSLDGLISAKKAAGRRKDRDHLDELEELKKMKENPPEG